MYRNIVVGWDGTDGARDALALAGELRAVDGTVTAACIYTPAPASGSAPLERTSRDEGVTRKWAEELLPGAQVNAGPDATWLKTLAVPAASAAEGLRALADDRCVSAVVIGSSRDGRPGRVHTGTVGRRLLNGPSWTLALAPRAYREQATKPRVVAALFDGSHQLLAVDKAAELARSLGGSLRLLCVVPPLKPWARSASEDAGYNWNDLSRGRSADYSQLLDQAAARLAEPPAAARLLEGRPLQHLLVEAAKGVDVLVIGAPATGDLQWALSGVTPGTKVSAPCPLLVLASDGTSAQELALPTRDLRAQDHPAPERRFAAADGLSLESRTVALLRRQRGRRASRGASSTRT